jgi:hypothetical protein
MRHKIQENPPVVYDQRTDRIVLVLVPCQVFPGRLCGICRKKKPQGKGAEGTKLTEPQS